MLASNSLKICIVTSEVGMLGKHQQLIGVFNYSFILCCVPVIFFCILWFEICTCMTTARQYCYCWIDKNELFDVRFLTLIPTLATITLLIFNSGHCRITNFIYTKGKKLSLSIKFVQIMHGRTCKCMETSWGWKAH